MKSIGARLTVWYAVATTITLGCLLFFGRYLLQQQLVRGIDLLNETEFKQIKAALGPDAESLKPETVEARIRQATEISSVLFYIQIHRPGPMIIFKSTNLHDIELPDIPGQEINSFVLPVIGKVRVQEFILGSLEVQVATSLAQVDNVIEGYTETGLMLVGAALVVSAGIGFALSRVALRPVRIIQETATHIGSDNLSERIPVGHVDDEISNLARLLNQMFDRLEAAFNQTRRFTAEASHELKTPLSLVRLQAEKLMIEGGLRPAQEEAVQMQLEEIARLNQIIEELLFLSRAEARAITLQRRMQSPRKFLDAFAADARVLAESRGTHFVEKISGDAEVEFDAKWIRQVLLNLVANALNAAPRGSVITLCSELTGDGWRVAIEDEGPGVPEEQRERIFERFVRLTPNGTGSGLGLAISRSVVGLHRGTIHAEPAASGRGLRVIFEIPSPPGGRRPLELAAAVGAEAL